MRTKDIEPHAIELGLEPKHLVLGKGGRVRYFICTQKKDGKERIVLFDHQGVAHTSQWVYYISEEFFDKVDVRMRKDTAVLYVNELGVTADKESSELNYCK